MEFGLFQRVLSRSTTRVARETEMHVAVPQGEGGAHEAVVTFPNANGNAQLFVAVLHHSPRAPPGCLHVTAVQSGGTHRDGARCRIGRLFYRVESPRCLD